MIFLGDLFDGGREWSTAPSRRPETQSPDKRWNKYGEEFWFREYCRFGRIFFDPWLQGGQVTRRGQRGRKMLAGLPGNHDLGFGNGIRLPVRERFNAYFGDGNRVDVIGNHTFVSLDTVSLSANGQTEATTRSQEDGAAEERTHKIWEPAEKFLLEVKAEKARKVKQELRLQAGLPENELLDHRVLDLNDHHSSDSPNISNSDANIPSVLLTHVPLYRAPGIPCGPLRERYPPSRLNADPGEEPLKDARNALPVAAGDQYQTVLSAAISNEIIEKVGGVEDVFSGDDHDYCEIIHRGYTSKNGGVREITVKAMSYSSGIRKPGFLMLSLWNPIDAQGNPIGARGDASQSRTIETHLCLLPDQLSILMRYGLLFGVTLVSLLVRAIFRVYGDGASHVEHDHDPLPLYKVEAPSSRQETISASARSWAAFQPNALHTPSLMHPFSNGLAARSSTTRTRSASPFDEYGLPVNEKAPSFLEENYHLSRDERLQGKQEWKEVMLDDTARRRRGGKLAAIYREWMGSLKLVGSIALGWYIWLLWTA